MNFFDPDVLNRMAHKVAAVDALMKNPNFHSTGPDVGMKVMIPSFVIRDLSSLSF